MEDRFKFRGIHPVLNELLEVKFIDYVKGTVDFGDGDIFLINDDIKLQQATGLKDKNGKLIFEDDIVKFKTELFGKPKQIIWDECHYRLKNTFIILCNMEIKQFGLEVIGNIYTNPELLESEGK